VPDVETVLGPIDGAALGFTLSHEHVLVAMGEDNHHYPWLFDWERTRANAVRELNEAKAGGVETIIDLTTPDLGRDVEFVRDVALTTGVHIVVATGIWRDVPRSFWERGLERIADIFVHEIEVGIGETGIKAGVI
jgi:phosphotriesterase-related protein